jgi:ATP phosphoribosyltransferase
MLRIALPDGHQQGPTIDLLRRADLLFEGYTDGLLSRRPVAAMEGVVAKVIRPQDMPLQVANGNFDFAITGLDWLTDHKSRFPASPVMELADLGYGKVRIVAAVSGELPASNPNGVRHWMAKRDKTHLRVASEYVNLVDKYARDHHLAPYRVIPTWGATEAFIPEDADLLVENTETGTTLARNNLKIIDTLFVSSARLIGRVDPQESDILKQRKETIIEILRRAADTSS